MPSRRIRKKKKRRSLKRRLAAKLTPGKSSGESGETETSDERPTPDRTVPQQQQRQQLVSDTEQADQRASAEVKATKTGRDGQRDADNFHQHMHHQYHHPVGDGGCAHQGWLGEGTEARAQWQEGYHRRGHLKAGSGLRPSASIGEPTSESSPTSMINSGFRGQRTCATGSQHVSSGTPIKALHSTSGGSQRLHQSGAEHEEASRSFGSCNDISNKRKEKRDSSASGDLDGCRAPRGLSSKGHATPLPAKKPPMSTSSEENVKVQLIATNQLQQARKSDISAKENAPVKQSVSLPKEEGREKSGSLKRSERRRKRCKSSLSAELAEKQILKGGGDELRSPIKSTKAVQEFPSGAAPNPPNTKDALTEQATRLNHSGETPENAEHSQDKCSSPLPSTLSLSTNLSTSEDLTDATLQDDNIFAANSDGWVADMWEGGCLPTTWSTADHVLPVDDYVSAWSQDLSLYQQQGATPPRYVSKKPAERLVFTRQGDSIESSEYAADDESTPKEEMSFDIPGSDTVAGSLLFGGLGALEKATSIITKLAKEISPEPKPEGALSGAIQENVPCTEGQVDVATGSPVTGCREPLPEGGRDNSDLPGCLEAQAAGGRDNSDLPGCLEAQAEGGRDNGDLPGCLEAQAEGGRDNGDLPGCLEAQAAGWEIIGKDQLQTPRAEVSIPTRDVKDCSHCSKFPKQEVTVTIAAPEDNGEVNPARLFVSEGGVASSSVNHPAPLPVDFTLAQELGVALCSEEEDKGKGDIPGWSGTSFDTCISAAESSETAHVQRGKQCDDADFVEQTCRTLSLSADGAKLDHVTDGDLRLYSARGPSQESCNVKSDNISRLSGEALLTKTFVENASASTVLDAIADAQERKHKECELAPGEKVLSIAYDAEQQGAMVLEERQSTGTESGSAPYDSLEDDTGLQQSSKIESRLREDQQIRPAVSEFSQKPLLVIAEREREDDEDNEVDLPSLVTDKVSKDGRPHGHDEREDVVDSKKVQEQTSIKIGEPPGGIDATRAASDSLEDDDESLPELETERPRQKSGPTEQNSLQARHVYYEGLNDSLEDLTLRQQTLLKVQADEDGDTAMGGLPPTQSKVAGMEADSTLVIDSNLLRALQHEQWLLNQGKQAEKAEHIFQAHAPTHMPNFTHCSLDDGGENAVEVQSDQKAVRTIQGKTPMQVFTVGFEGPTGPTAGTEMSTVKSSEDSSSSLSVTENKQTRRQARATNEQDVQEEPRVSIKAADLSDAHSARADSVNMEMHVEVCIFMQKDEQVLSSLTLAQLAETRHQEHLAQHHSGDAKNCLDESETGPATKALKPEVKSSEEAQGTRRESPTNGPDLLFTEANPRDELADARESCLSKEVAAASIAKEDTRDIKEAGSSEMTDYKHGQQEATNGAFAGETRKAALVSTATCASKSSEKNEERPTGEILVAETSEVVRKHDVSCGHRSDFERTTGNKAVDDATEKAVHASLRDELTSMRNLALAETAERHFEVARANVGGTCAGTPQCKMTTKNSSERKVIAEEYSKGDEQGSGQSDGALHTEDMTRNKRQLHAATEAGTAGDLTGAVACMSTSICAALQCDEQSLEQTVKGRHAETIYQEHLAKQRENRPVVVDEKYFQKTKVTSEDDEQVVGRKGSRCLSDTATNLPQSIQERAVKQSLETDCRMLHWRRTAEMAEVFYHETLVRFVEVIYHEPEGEGALGASSMDPTGTGGDTLILFAPQENEGKEKRDLQPCEVSTTQQTTEQLDSLEEEIAGFAEDSPSTSVIQGKEHRCTVQFVTNELRHEGSTETKEQIKTRERPGHVSEIFAACDAENRQLEDVLEEEEVGHCDEATSVNVPDAGARCQLTTEFRKRDADVVRCINASMREDWRKLWDQRQAFEAEANHQAVQAFEAEANHQAAIAERLALQTREGKVLTVTANNQKQHESPRNETRLVLPGEGSEERQALVETTTIEQSQGSTREVSSQAAAADQLDAHNQQESQMNLVASGKEDFSLELISTAESSELEDLAQQQVELALDEALSLLSDDEAECHGSQAMLMACNQETLAAVHGIHGLITSLVDGALNEAFSLIKQKACEQTVCYKQKQKILETQGAEDEDDESLEPPMGDLFDTSESEDEEDRKDSARVSLKHCIVGEMAGKEVAASGTKDIRNFIDSEERLNKEEEGVLPFESEATPNEREATPKPREPELVDNASESDFEEEIGDLFDDTETETDTAAPTAVEDLNTTVLEPTMTAVEPTTVVGPSTTLLELTNKDQVHQRESNRSHTLEELAETEVIENVVEVVEQVLPATKILGSKDTNRIETPEDLKGTSKDQANGRETDKVIPTLPKKTRGPPLPDTVLFLYGDSHRLHGLQLCESAESAYQEHVASLEDVNNNNMLMARATSSQTRVEEPLGQQLARDAFSPPVGRSDSHQSDSEKAMASEILSSSDFWEEVWHSYREECRSLWQLAVCEQAENAHMERRHSTLNTSPKADTIEQVMPDERTSFLDESKSESTVEELHPGTITGTATCKVEIAMPDVFGVAFVEASCQDYENMRQAKEAQVAEEVYMSQYVIENEDCQELIEIFADRSKTVSDRTEDVQLTCKETFGGGQPFRQADDVPKVGLYKSLCSHLDPYADSDSEEECEIHGRVGKRKYEKAAEEDYRFTVAQDASNIPANESMDEKFKQKLLNEMAQRKAMEQLVEILEEEGRQLRRRLAEEQNRVADLKCAVKQLQSKLREEQKISESSRGECAQMKKANEEDLNKCAKLQKELNEKTKAYQSLSDSLMDARLAENRATSAESRARMLETELVAARNQSRRLLVRLASVDRDRSAILSETVHHELLSIADGRANLADSKVQQLESKLIEAKTHLEEERSRRILPTTCHSIKDYPSLISTTLASPSGALFNSPSVSTSTSRVSTSVKGQKSQKAKALAATATARIVPRQNSPGTPIPGSITDEMDSDVDESKEAYSNFNFQVFAMFGDAEHQSMYTTSDSVCSNSTSVSGSGSASGSGSTTATEDSPDRQTPGSAHFFGVQSCEEKSASSRKLALASSFEMSTPQTTDTLFKPITPVESKSCLDDVDLPEFEDLPSSTDMELRISESPSDVPSELSDWSSSSGSEEECELRIVEGDENEEAGGQQSAAPATTAVWTSPQHRKAHTTLPNKPSYPGPKRKVNTKPVSVDAASQGTGSIPQVPSLEKLTLGETKYVRDPNGNQELPTTML